jgi:hypothetical protein
MSYPARAARSGIDGKANGHNARHAMIDLTHPAKRAHA